MSLIRTKSTLIAAAFAISTAWHTTADAQNRCGSVLAAQQQQAINPSFRRGIEQAKAQSDEWLAKHPNGDETRAIITIPVVVHVVYQNSTQNISNAQIQSQIDVLNNDFARTNADASNTPAAFASLCGDTEIRFCLASLDPSGNSTNGIVRKAAGGSYSSSSTSFGSNDAMKFNSQGGSDAWDRNKYLNIWVCNLGNGLLGYAYQPGATAGIDGVVIGYNYFGTMGTASAPFNKGRTTTHEVGHWLNLDHIWGDDGTSCSGSDNVSDTPNQAGENYGCPSYPKTDACATSSPGVMFMNYMDYVDDNCMNMFTLGQGTRMKAALNGPRASLKTSNGCSGSTSQTLDAGIVSIVSPGTTLCTTTFQPQVTLTNAGNIIISSATINYTITGGPSGTYPWTGNLGAGTNVTITLPAVTVSAGSHTITMTVASPNSGTDANSANNSSSKTFNVTNSTGVNAPFAEGFQGTFPAAGWAVNNPNNDAYLWTSYTAGGQGGSTKSVVMDNFNNSVKGTIDEFVLPAINTNGLNAPVVDFWVAHKYYPYMNSTTGETWIDTLQVLMSTDCGVTYTSLGKLSGVAMVNSSSTDTLSTAGFTPVSESSWKKFFANLPNNASVTIKFRNIGQYGQKVYIDNINIHAAFGVGVEDMITSESFAVYPNPASGQFTAKYEAAQKGDVSIQVVDLTGKEISRLDAIAQEGANEFMIPLNNFSAGYYFVRLTVGNQSAVRKLVVE